jgi:uncharacterized membrane protein
VTTTISYAVEITGIRTPLWRWNHPDFMTWLPFEMPADAFEGWMTTSFVIMLIYCAVRYRLFGGSVRRNTAATALIVGLFAIAVVAQQRTGNHETPLRLLVVTIYLALSTALGFTAGGAMLGSSEAARPSNE